MPQPDDGDLLAPPPAPLAPPPRIANPPCSGNWTRLSDSALAPADELTAINAGIEWVAPQDPEE